MKSRVLRAALLVAGVAVVVIWFRQDFAAAARLFRSHWSLAATAGLLLLTALHFVNEPLRWSLLLGTRPTGPTLLKVYHGLTATALGSYLLPVRLGVPMRVLMAKRVLHLDYPTAGAIMIGDAGCFYGTWALVAIAGGMTLVPASVWFGPATVLVVLLGAVLATLAAVRLELLRAPRFALGARFLAGIRLLTVKVAAANTALVAADICFYGVRHGLILAMLGVHCSLLDVTLVVAISIFAGFVSLMPGGAGAYDFSLAFLLTVIGAPREAAVAVPVMHRMVTVSTGVLLGAVSVHHLGVAWREEMSAEVRIDPVSAVR